MSHQRNVSVASIGQTYCGIYTAEGQIRLIPLLVLPFAVTHVNRYKSAVLAFDKGSHSYLLTQHSSAGHGKHKYTNTVCIFTMYISHDALLHHGTC